MGVESWSITAKLCDSCKASPAAVFCRAESAFLCGACDAKIHSANKLASRHGRVWICEVCEQAPAAFTCKADAAVLCATCDRDIHSANPLARRHERVPFVPFYDAITKSTPSAECSEEEAEAASWLLPDPNTKAEDQSGSPEYMSAEYLFTDIDPYLDLDLKSGDQKPHLHQIDEQKHYSSDGVVPVQNESGQYVPGPVVDGFPTFEMDYAVPKPFMYNFTSQSIIQSVSSSSMEVGVVPDAAESLGKSESVAVLGMDREARVLRYREKRKNRKFEKTIRYASRKAYAETRPRIKGRFAKRSELEVESLLGGDAASYGVVPSF
ncbi:zinc finger protein CONSTANS-LIKE 4-like isoform X2 [Salvia splendens]|uniref:zinc finger protein CONSTANS-LIKE 4-like isoform X2 n=1 Tax=Salvia splendens TaxID=180675 RepID=UPI001C268C4A|nr:zinc finger protein CONSTANS-LIKE 4-like isoform X2 [Salvia splendens]